MAYRRRLWATRELGATVTAGTSYMPLPVHGPHEALSQRDPLSGELRFVVVPRDAAPFYFSPSETI